ncbi:helix-turn-helix domain-containing protein [Hydrocarboniphaga effusa]|uniref:helix-turn-helix domain-containing protein n=1 Tax=Hydrocarboniphaga effusa TaxID=243629 RepID=UPI003BA84367
MRHTNSPNGITVSPAIEQHEHIKLRLRLVGSSLADVARELSVAATTVTSVSQGHRRSRRIEEHIAEKLGLSASELWADRYPRARGQSDGDRSQGDCQGSRRAYC